MHPIEQLLANKNITATDIETTTRLKHGTLQKLIDKDIRTSDIKSARPQSNGYLS